MSILFVSDVHLSIEKPRTTEAFLYFLQHQAKNTKQLYVLGDLFEYWVGDEQRLESYYQPILKAFAELKRAHIDLYWIAGNRDFLVGAQFLSDAGLKALEDPYLMQIGEHAVLISHGDIYCTDDVNYQKIRQQLRAPNWQQQFLQQALVVRKEQVRAWRKQSQEAQKGAAEYLLDVNQDSISQWFEKTGATRMVHGHTHRPGCYLSADQKLRYVLPDWDYDEAPLRGGYLSIEDDQWALSLNSNYPK